MAFWNKKDSARGQEYKEENATLRVIGDRTAGKTTYMAALAYWPNANPNSPVQEVVPVGENGQELIQQARNILEEGLNLEPTPLDTSVDNIKDYTISINLKNDYSWLEKRVKLTINCKDYSGEFFKDLLYKTGDPSLNDYIDDCLIASGLLFLIDGTSYKKDSEYAIGIEKFLFSLDKSLLTPTQKRIAVVMTKCEQPELWVNRHKPYYIIDSRFPQLKQKLANWSKNTGGKVDYFITSAFGVLGNQYPEPNAIKTERLKEGTKAVLKDPKRWRPFGLVSPIYWLCTGKRHKQLDQI